MKIAIVGGAGGMGKWLVNHFLEIGHTVIVADPNANRVISGVELIPNNAAAASKADVVVVSVPMEETASVIREVSPHMRENAILCEISTLKSNTIDDLRKVALGNIRPLSIHPLFGPGASDLKKRYALIPVYDSHEEKNIAESLFPESQIIVVEADIHDRIMALTLSLPYFMNMIFASVLKDEDISLMQQLSGTTFAVQFMLTGSIMSHTSEFHRTLHRENAYFTEILQKLLAKTTEEVKRLNSDIEGFEKSYRNIKSSLEEKLSLEDKYKEMYRVLKVMEEEGLKS
ncbi:MAG: prephenate dehydrogenase/arogenate dehydrogenase family protein [Candidatus Thorarchaeota archaeon]